MKPRSNGIVELHDDNRKDKSFNCMKLIKYMVEDGGYTEWGAWHSAYDRARHGNCPFANVCSIYKRTAKQPKQLELFVRDGG